MKIKKVNSIKYFFKKVLLKVVAKINNENNCGFYSNGEFSLLKNVQEIYKNNKKPITLFDVGANIGEYSLKIIQLFNGIHYTLHLFEPTQSCFKVLTEKFDTQTDIHLNQVALSDKAGESSIYYDSQKSGLASLYKRDVSLGGNTLSHEETIKTIRLDSYIQDNSIVHIDFLKLDVEGHELSVLRGMGEYLNGSFVDFIQFEYGGCNLDSRTTLKDIISLLEKNGFFVYKIMPKYLEKFSYDSSYENFRYSNYVAISRDNSFV